MGFVELGQNQGFRVVRTDIEGADLLAEIRIDGEVPRGNDGIEVCEDGIVAGDVGLGGFEVGHGRFDVG